MSEKNRRTEARQSRLEGCTETAKSEILSARSEHSQEFTWENTLTRCVSEHRKGVGWGGVLTKGKPSEWWHRMDICLGIQMFQETPPGTFLTEAWQSRLQLMQGLSAIQSIDNK